MKTTERISNEGYTSDLPFIEIDGMLIRPTEGPRWSDITTGDTYIPVEIKSYQGREYKVAQLHKEVDCDGTFYYGYLAKEFKGVFECVNDYEYASFKEMELIWNYFKAN